MSDKVYPVSPKWAERALITDAQYKADYARSVKDPTGFWGEVGVRSVTPEYKCNSSYLLTCLKRRKRANKSSLKLEKVGRQLTLKII